MKRRKYGCQRSRHRKYKLLLLRRFYYTRTNDHSFNYYQRRRRRRHNCRSRDDNDNQLIDARDFRKLHEWCPARVAGAAMLDGARYTFKSIRP